MSTWIALAVVAAIAIYVVILFNRLVKSRQLTREGWSGIDVQLKRRADLIPNLADTVKGYASHERNLLEEIARLRTELNRIGRDDVTGREQVEGALSGALGRLIALAEAYPDLKASSNFLALQQQLVDIEDKIQMARRYYNGATRNLNVLVESFPSNLVANIFRFQRRAYFEIEKSSDRAVPTVSLNRQGD